MNASEGLHVPLMPPTSSSSAPETRRDGFCSSDEPFQALFLSSRVGWSTCWSRAHVTRRPFRVVRRPRVGHRFVRNEIAQPNAPSGERFLSSFLSQRIPTCWLRKREHEQIYTREPLLGLIRRTDCGIFVPPGRLTCAFSLSAQWSAPWASRILGCIQP